MMRLPSPHPHDYIRAARVPAALRPQEHGLWTIKRVTSDNPWVRLQLGGFDSYTILYRLTEGTMHHPPGDVVMEDSKHELARHLPIWLAARGRVLITGLGLGCVLRGLLANPAVQHVDVIELDRWILEVVGAEFRAEPRVSLHRGDALEYRFPARATWDYAWHDLYVDDSAADLHIAHMQLLARYRKRVAWQGAWQFPRCLKRLPKVRSLFGAAA